MSGKDTPTNASLRMLRLKNNSMCSRGSSAGSLADLTVVLAVISRARASTPTLRRTARSSTTPVERKHPRYTVYPNDNEIRYMTTSGLQTKTRYFFSTSTAGNFERCSGSAGVTCRQVSKWSSCGRHHHVCYRDRARPSFALYYR